MMVIIMRIRETSKFPYRSQGGFIQPPMVLQQGDQKLVEWKIPSVCELNELLYAPQDNQNNYGGIGANCRTIDGTSDCSVNIEMLVNEATLDVQANSTDCSSGQTFISDPLSISSASVR
jgi:hypothetical protein